MKKLMGSILKESEKADWKPTKDISFRVGLIRGGYGFWRDIPAVGSATYSERGITEIEALKLGEKVYRVTTKIERIK